MIATVLHPRPIVQQISRLQKEYFLEDIFDFVVDNIRQPATKQ